MNVNGTYSQPVYPNTAATAKSTVQKRRSADAERIQGSPLETKADDLNSIQDAKAAQSSSVPISEDEKQFFQELFPTAAEEIRAYTPYQKNGQQQPAQIGSLFDVRG